MDDISPLIARISSLESQIGMYEKLFQTLSAKLDHHFKKYDTVVNAQQQQINLLTDVLSTLLNDQHRYSGIQREKLGNTLAGVASTGASLSGVVAAAGPGRQPKQATDPHFAFQHVLGSQSDHLAANSYTDDATSHRGAERHSSDSYHSDNSNTSAESDKSETREPPKPRPEPHKATDIEHKRYELFSGKFRFLASPQSVTEVWKEYTEGLAGQPSLKEMESTYRSSWRRDAGVSRKFYRRKVLCRAIETGLDKGYALEDIIDTLERHRKQKTGRQEKLPIGWLCHQSNIPSMFK
ncbi:LAQU0S07e00584g1_1 [Lachancea quebecensis]|uniref:LAQU0S07e00584g1_1 n=1 Tax=Lachancea quebecensis TaxID=1654605 RepID=A0A0P1KSJ3_9SACH|nr:LAQU0S07e00584g1_1 [Lachancea quebecensis]